MLLFDKAFHQYGLRNTAQLHAQVGAFLRIKQSQKLVPYVLLVGRDVTNADGDTNFMATLPGRAVSVDYEEYSFINSENRMFPRKVINHILDETIGVTANTITSPVKDEPKAEQAEQKNREDLSKAAVEFELRTKKLMASYNDLFREDVRALGRDATGTVIKDAETVFFAANFGNKQIALPQIVLIKDGAVKPEHVNNDDVARIDEIRRHTQWFKLADVMGSVRQNFPGNPFDPEEAGPQFRLEGLSFASGKGRKIKSVPLATEALYGLILLSKMETFRTTFRADSINPETKKPWVSSEDIRAHLELKASKLKAPEPTKKWTTYANLGSTAHV